MKKSVKLLALVLALMVALTGCSMIQPNQDRQNAQVVATVNGEEITYGEVIGYVTSLANMYVSYGYVAEDYFTTDAGQRTLASMKTDYLNVLIENVATYQKAVEAGYEVADADVDAKVAEDKALYGSSYELMLSMSGYTEETYWNIQKRDLTVEAYKTGLYKDTVVTDEELADWYGKNSSKYASEKSKAKASHILFAADDKENAEMVLGVLQSGLFDFATVAPTYSIDTASAQNGGSLGEFEEGDMVETFNNAIFFEGNGVGLVDHLVESEFGWHIIYIEELNFADAPELSEIYDRVKVDYIAETTYALWEDHVAELVEAADVKINEKKLNP